MKFYVTLCGLTLFNDRWVNWIWNIFCRRIASYSKGARKNVMIRIATLSVTISVAVMIVSLAVILGFRKEITAKLTGFDAHIQIVHLNAYTSNETIPIDRNLPFLSQLRRIPGCVRVVPYAQKIGIPRGERALQGIMLKGVDSTYDWSFFQKNLVEGSVPDVRGERNKDILISRSLADLLEVSVGDPLEMLFIQESRPRDRFRVSGIYDTHFGELDQTVALTDLRNVQRLNGWDSTQITGYEVTVSDFSKLDQFTDSVYQVIMDNVPAEDQSPVRVVNLRERFPMIFDWLNAHNVNVGGDHNHHVAGCAVQYGGGSADHPAREDLDDRNPQDLGHGQSGTAENVCHPFVVRRAERAPVGKYCRDRVVFAAALHRMGDPE